MAPTLADGVRVRGKTALRYYTRHKIYTRYAKCKPFVGEGPSETRLRYAETERLFPRQPSMTSSVFACMEFVAAALWLRTHGIVVSREYEVKNLNWTRWYVRAYFGVTAAVHRLRIYGLLCVNSVFDQKPTS